MEGFLELLPDLLLTREVIEEELPGLPPLGQARMSLHLQGLTNSINFIERLGQ